jgi:hypothetical protein
MAKKEVATIRVGLCLPYDLTANGPFEVLLSAVLVQCSESLIAATPTRGSDGSTIAATSATVLLASIRSMTR